MHNYCKLKILLGSMFSGKSTELIRLIRREQSINNNILVIKPIIDNRYSNEHICSHNNDRIRCITTNNLNEIIQLEEWDKINCIFIDEGQFFKGLYNFVIECLETYNKSVIIAGLDGDSNRKSFGEILSLIPLADEVRKLSAYCHYCKNGTLGIFTHRITNDKKQTLIGGANVYKAVCRQHYILLNKCSKTITC